MLGNGSEVGLIFSLVNGETVFNQEFFLMGKQKRKPGNLFLFFSVSVFSYSREATLSASKAGLFNTNLVTEPYLETITLL